MRVTLFPRLAALFILIGFGVGSGSAVSAYPQGNSPRAATNNRSVRAHFAFAPKPGSTPRPSAAIIGSTSWVGSVSVSSDRNVVALARPEIGSQVMAYDAFTAGGTTMFVPMLFRNAFGGSYNAALYIQNIDPANAADLTIRYRDTGGNLTCSHADTIPPLSSHGYWLASECVPDGWVGSATITASRAIVAIGRAHIGAEITSYDGFASGSMTMFAPMLFRNAFGGSYDAALYVQNVDSANVANITIAYHDSGGNLTCSHIDSIPPLSSHGYWLASECVPKGWVGSAAITSDRNIVAIGRPHIGSQVTAYDGFSTGALNAYVPMLYGGGSANASALYVQNMDLSNSAAITLQFYDRSGVLACTLTDSIPSLSSHGYWLPSLKCLPSGWMGDVAITSNHSIVALGRLHSGSEVAAYDGFASGATGQYLPMLFVRAFDGTYNSGTYLQNLDAGNAAHLTMQYFDVNGTPTFTATMTLPPLAAEDIWVPGVLTPDWQPTFPIRAAFYYPWFPEAWTQQNIYPYTNYTPELGFYSSSDSNILSQHLAQMQYAGIQAGIASWWGQGSRTDSRIAGLLSAASGTNFRWALYYENESIGDPSVSQIHSDLAYIRDHYGNDPNYLRVNGKFVVFVYADGADGCGMADRWTQANTVAAYVVLKVFNGYLTCATQPNAWHQYSPAVAADRQGDLSYSISPGFWQKGQTVRLARDVTRWTQNVQDMVASGASWQLVATFSEWGEGTAVEPALEWASASGYGQYLDVLHFNGSMPAP